MTICILGFPGIGKTFATQNSTLKIIQLNRHGKLEMTPELAKQIHSDITDAFLQEVDYVLIEYHPLICEVCTLVPHIVVYPSIGLKDEYTSRYTNLDAGDVSDYTKSILENWTQWITDLNIIEGVNTIVLESGEYLSDIFNFKLEIPLISKMLDLFDRIVSDHEDLVDSLKDCKSSFLKVESKKTGTLIDRTKEIKG